MNRAAVVALILLLAAAALVGVGLRGDGPDVQLPRPGEGPVSYSRHVEPVVVHRCLRCHTHDEAEAGLVLEPGSGYQAMVEVPSTQVQGLRMVNPGSLETSYLWLKLDHRAAVGEGMPRTFLGSRRLPDDELQAFRRWIAEGAHP